MIDWAAYRETGRGLAARVRLGIPLDEVDTSIIVPSNTHFYNPYVAADVGNLIGQFYSGSYPHKCVGQAPV